jgi:hypothetical protein
MMPIEVLDLTSSTNSTAATTTMWDLLCDPSLPCRMLLGFDENGNEILESDADFAARIRREISR